MSKTPEFRRSTEQLNEVATLLKQADKLVKEGKYSAALDEIAKARTRDPRNLYAVAYEDRVRSLLKSSHTKPEKNTLTAGAQPTSIPVLPPALEQISNLALAQAERSLAEALAAEHAERVQRKNEDEREKKQALRGTIEAKIDGFLARASEFLQKEDYNRALDEVARAYLLDPANARIREFEEQVRSTREKTRSRRDEDRAKREQKRVVKGEGFWEAQLTRREKERRERDASKTARELQETRARQGINKALSLFEAGKLDDALAELASTAINDPLHTEVVALERKFREAQERIRQEELAFYRIQKEEQRKKREAILRAIKKHIESADRLIGQQRFSEALRVITRAFVLDPMNEDLHACQSRIVAAQERGLKTDENQQNGPTTDEPKR